MRTVYVRTRTLYPLQQVSPANGVQTITSSRTTHPFLLFPIHLDRHFGSRFKIVVALVVVVSKVAIPTRINWLSGDLLR